MARRLPVWDTDGQWGSYSSKSDKIEINNGGLDYVVGLATIANYLEDDWGDNALSSRTGAADGAYAHPAANEAGDTLIGRYRPNWAVESGSPSATNNELQLPDGSTTEQTVSTPSEMTTGSFEIKYQFAANPSNGALHYSVLCSDFSLVANVTTDSGYEARTVHNGDYNLTRRDSGSATDIIVSSWSVDTNQHTKRVTRNSYSSFELFLDGASKGTATDGTFTESVVQFIGNNSTDRVDIDDLVVK